MLEALPIGLCRMVYIQMVRVCRCDDGDEGGEVVEGAVKLICLYDSVVAMLREEEVRLIIVGDPAEEGVAIYVALS